MADKKLTAKDMSMIFEETCLTVKDVKKLLEKLPDDMIVVNDESNYYRPIGDINIETIDYCTEGGKIVSGKVVGIY
ncbi:hypothetical protein [Anaerostipes hadrus]|jgi:hypothetical protein|uniref:hypothetical protein n=1 Tax=Anaerostipes hadrus TaxID=649756 RepID=UPI00157004FA|nr:hypothetical protein [Anaerostipes hadrus]NSG72488.1 hypothetical protein [Anaerostipes hadrus]